MSDYTDFNRGVIEEFRANEGRVGGRFEGAPMVILHTRGAKSGEPREHPLVSFEEDGRRFVIGSAAGAQRHPAWFHNLVAHPDVSYEFGTETRSATARVLEGEDRDAIWAVVVERMPGFGEYQENTSRVIPVIELVPA